MNKRSKVTLIIGAIVFVSSIAVFAVIHPRVFPSTILGLCFLLYSEVVLFGGFVLVDMLSARASKLLLWSGVGTTIDVYGVIVFISSLIHMTTKTSLIQGFLILQIVLLVIVLAVCLIIWNFSLGMRRNDSKVLQVGATLQYILDQLVLIKEKTSNKAEIDRLIEAVQYSDTSVTVDADIEINDAITHLDDLTSADELDNAEFENTVQNIEFLIKKRNLQAKATKRGGV